MRPLSDKLIVEKIKNTVTLDNGMVLMDSAKTAGGIYLPAEMKDEHSPVDNIVRAKVLEAGPGRIDEDGEFRHPMVAAPGDTVIISEMQATNFKDDDGNDHTAVMESDVLAILKEDGDPVTIFGKEEKVSMPYPYFLVERNTNAKEKKFDSGVTIYLPEEQRYKNKVVTIKSSYKVRQFPTKKEISQIEPGWEAIVTAFDGDPIDPSNENLLRVNELQVMVIIVPMPLRTGIVDAARKKTYLPFHNYVIVKMEEADSDKVSAGGIHIPETANDRKKVLKGQVLAVGPGLFNRAGVRRHMETPLYSRVVFYQYSGVELTIDDQKYKILKDTEIVAVLDDTEKQQLLDNFDNFGENLQRLCGTMPPGLEDPEFEAMIAALEQEMGGKLVPVELPNVEIVKEPECRVITEVNDFYETSLVALDPNDPCAIPREAFKANLESTPEDALVNDNPVVFKYTATPNDVLIDHMTTSMVEDIRKGPRPW